MRQGTEAVMFQLPFQERKTTSMVNTKKREAKKGFGVALNHRRF
jgi:hypothetical protein